MTYWKLIPTAQINNGATNRVMFGLSYRRFKYQSITGKSTTAKRPGHQEATIPPSKRVDTGHQPVIPTSKGADNTGGTSSGYESGSEKDKKQVEEREAWRTRRKKQRADMVKGTGPDPKKAENIPSDTSGSGYSDEPGQLIDSSRDPTTQSS